MRLCTLSTNFAASLESGSNCLPVSEGCRCATAMGCMRGRCGAGVHVGSSGEFVNEDAPLRS